METFITDFRRRVANHLRAECTSLPVFKYLPDDPAHIPCAVVGRPRLAEAAQPAVMDLSLDVAVLGRRVADDDAQAELDALTDDVVDAWGGTRGVKVDDVSFHQTGVEPGTVLVAGVEYPAYLVTVESSVMSC